MVDDEQANTPASDDAAAAHAKGENKMYVVRTDGHRCSREIVEDNRFTFAHTSTQQNLLMWSTRPSTVLVLKKKGDALLPELVHAVAFLQRECLRVMLERDVKETLVSRCGAGVALPDEGCRVDEDDLIDMDALWSFDGSSPALADAVDLIVCLGGDGVILHANSLFPDAVPPVTSFNLGSMGFLANLHFRDFREDMKAVIEGNKTNGSTVRSGGSPIIAMRAHASLARPVSAEHR